MTDFSSPPSRGRSRGRKEGKEKRRSQYGYVIDFPPGKERPSSTYLYLHGYLSTRKDVIEESGPIPSRSTCPSLSRFVVVAPICPFLYWWDTDKLIDFILYLKETYPSLCSGKMVLGGASMGSFAAWSLLSRVPHFFRSAHLVSGGVNPMRLVTSLPYFSWTYVDSSSLKRVRIPVWSVRSRKDLLFDSSSTLYLKNISSLGCDVRETIFPSYGHVSTCRRGFQIDEIYSWL